MHHGVYLTAFLLAALFLVGGASAGTLVQFRTTRGTIDVELYDQDKPATVANFLRYVRSNAYANTFFHSDFPGQVVVAGGFTANSNSASIFAGAPAIPRFAAVTNEFNVGTQFPNVQGTLAMYKDTANANSATSQFFFNLGNNANLDTLNGGYTVFGHVIRGTNVLNNFNPLGYGGNGLWNFSNYGTAFAQVPVTYFGGTSPHYYDLFFVDITTLNIQTKNLPGKRQQFSWNSVAGLVNLVEYTASFPPNWQTLIATNGTGSTMSITNSLTNGFSRFYRVRVVY